jgi:hypothetical protein
MKSFNRIVGGFAVCGFALSLSIANAKAADTVEPSGYPWSSDPVASEAPASSATEKSPTSGQKWVAHPIKSRSVQATVVPTAAVQAAPRPGKPALAVARKFAPQKASSTPTVTPAVKPTVTLKGRNRRVAFQPRADAPTLLTQHEAISAQPVMPEVPAATPLKVRSVIVGQQESAANDESLPAPQMLSEELFVEDNSTFRAYPRPIMSLLASPWKQGESPWQEAACCVGDFCPIGKALCAVGQVTDYSEYSFGFAGFKDPVDMGSNGNFGLSAGLNTSGALLPWHGIGYQIGANFLNSNLSGHNTGNVSSRESRFSAYTTAGIFRRQMNTGLQGGVVWDWRHDEFYGDYDVHQVRGELSFKHQCADEFGVWFTVNTRDDLLRRVGAGADSIISTNELYAFFYRKSWESGGEGRMYAGFSGEKDGIIGGDIRLPVSDHWALDAQATYLIPNEPNGLAGTTAASWGLGINMVWTPKYGGGDGLKYPFRALLSVASPATMMGIFK